MTASTPTVKDINSYLTARKTDTELSIDLTELEALYNKKLWHQLTLKLGSFITHPRLQEGNELIELYNNFIQAFENKINPLALVEMIAFVAPKYKDTKDAIALLAATEAKVKANSEAVALCKILAGQIYLDKLDDRLATEKIIREVETILHDADGLTSVHGRFYRLASWYYDLQDRHADYYRTALRYLGCVDLSELSPAKRVQHALNLGLAALLAEGIYDLGELLTHPILQALKPDNKWFVDLLIVFNAGDVGLFETAKPIWRRVPVLAANERNLRRKISVICLVQMTFKRAPSERVLTFNEIACETRLPLGEGELLAMLVFAQGLARGTIDQVDGTVHMTWVRPRLLDNARLSTMADRLGSWWKEVDKTEALFEERGHDFLAL